MKNPNATRNDELEEIVFGLTEDLSRNEELLNQVKLELENIKSADSSGIKYDVETISQKLEQQQETINDIKQAYQTQLEQLESVQRECTSDKEKLNELLTLKNDITSLKKNLRSVSNISDLESINNKVDNKIILKQEIARFQSITIGILAFLAIVVIAFFVLIVITAELSATLVLAFFVAVLPFCVATYLTNNNIKNLISQEKQIPLKPRK